MQTYLEPTDPEAFVDHPVQDVAFAAQYGMPVECPQCKGHGGWNLKLNAYPLHGKEDNAHNRHLFSHFRASCSQCNGWGYVRHEDADHIHQWETVERLGNCLHLDRCKVCGREWQVDSSD